MKENKWHALAVCRSFETVSFADLKVPQSLSTGCKNYQGKKLEILGTTQDLK